MFPIRQEDAGRTETLRSSCLSVDGMVVSPLPKPRHRGPPLWWRRQVPLPPVPSDLAPQPLHGSTPADEAWLWTSSGAPVGFQMSQSVSRSSCTYIRTLIHTYTCSLCKRDGRPMCMHTEPHACAHTFTLLHMLTCPLSHTHVHTSTVTLLDTHTHINPMRHTGPWMQPSSSEDPLPGQLGLSLPKWLQPGELQSSRRGGGQLAALVGQLREQQLPCGC